MQLHLEALPHLVRHPFLAPHEILHMLYTRNQDAFSDFVLGKTGLSGLKEFWAAAMSQPWGKAHPVGAKSLEELSFCVPILWHIDGAEFSNSAEAVIYSASSAMTWGCSLDMCWLFTLAVSDNMVPRTNDEIVALANWCGTVLLSGEFPGRDNNGNLWPEGSWRGQMAGRRIAGPFFFAFAGNKGDMKGRRETHKFSRHYGCNYICDQCGASAKDPLLFWSNFGQDALWRRTGTTHGSYLRQTVRERQSAWTGHPGWHLSRVLFDWMHVGHMGVCRDFCAAMLYDICSEGFTAGDTLGHQLRALWLEMRDWLKTHKKKCPRRVCMMQVKISPIVREICSCICVLACFGISHQRVVPEMRTVSVRQQYCSQYHAMVVSDMTLAGFHEKYHWQVAIEPFPDHEWQHQGCACEADNHVAGAQIGTTSEPTPRRRWRWAR